MKNYTEEKVKTIVGNAIQNITNKLYKQQSLEEERAKIAALCFFDGNDKNDKAIALKHLYVENVVLRSLIKDIKDTQYHLKTEQFLKTHDIK